MDVASVAMFGAFRDQHRRARAGSFDRFIPAREIQNFPAASYKMSSPSAGQEMSSDAGASQDVFHDAGETGDTNNNECLLSKSGESQGDYRQRMALLSEGVTEANIFSFRPRQRSGSWSGYRHVATPKLPCRKLPSSPARALEVSGLNEMLVDSSRLFDINLRRQLALPLGREIHILELAQADVKFKSFGLGERAGRDDAHHGRPCLRWSPCGGALAICVPAFMLVDSELGKIISSVKVSSPPLSLDWSGHNLSAGFMDGTIHTYDTRSGLNPVGSFTGGGRSSAINTLRYSADGGLIACGTADGGVVIWDSRNRGKPQHELDGHSDGVGAMAWCPWKPWHVATGGKANDPTIRVWNVYTGILNKNIMAGSEVTSLAWCDQSSELVSSHGSQSGEANIRVWKSPKMHLVGEIRRHEGRVFQVGLTADGSKLLSVGSDEILCVWDFYQDTTAMMSPQGTSLNRRRSSTNPSPGKSPGPIASPLALGGIR